LRALITNGSIRAYVHYIFDRRASVSDWVSAVTITAYGPTLSHLLNPLSSISTGL